MSSPSQQLGLIEVLRVKAVRRLWIAQLVSVFGDFLVIFAVLSHASFNLKASPSQVTFIIVVFLVPYALVGPVVGVFVDRWNIKRTMIASDLIRAVLVLLLVFTDTLGWIYATLFLLSTVSTFFVPAQIIAIRALAPMEGLMSANALMQQAIQFVRIITPALAGALVGWFGARPCYLLDSGSFLVSAAIVGTLVITRKSAASAARRHPVAAVAGDLVATVRFIFTHSVLAFVILAMGAGVFALSCVGPLVAVYVRDELKSTEFVFGAINSALGVGMIVATLIISRFARHRSKSHMILLGLSFMAAGVMLMGTLKTIPTAALGLFGLGLGAGFVLVSGQTEVQISTPVDMVGRVSGSLWSLMSLAQLPGLLLSGSMARRIGIGYVFCATSVILIFMAAFGWLSLREPQPKRAALTEP
jgi:MFS transporter, DHA3 family, macrolide efflux protein